MQEELNHGWLDQAWSECLSSRLGELGIFDACKKSALHYSVYSGSVRDKKKKKKNCVNVKHYEQVKGSQLQKESQVGFQLYPYPFGLRGMLSAFHY